MATGFEQARSVVAAIAGDVEAADRVELDLPETGVCGISAARADEPEGSCCGTEPTAAAAVAAIPEQTGCSTKACGTKPAATVAAATSRCCG